jgi:hypothetical protein
MLAKATPSRPCGSSASVDNPLHTWHPVHQQVALRQIAASPGTMLESTLLRHSTASAPAIPRRITKLRTKWHFWRSRPRSRASRISTAASEPCARIQGRPWRARALSRGWRVLVRQGDKPRRESRRVPSVGPQGSRSDRNIPSRRRCVQFCIGWFLRSIKCSGRAWLLGSSSTML